MRCFKRYHTAKCEMCSKPVPLMERLRCFVNYMTWHTDPLPVEMLLGWIALLFGLVFIFNAGELTAPHFARLLEVGPSYEWGTIMLVFGLIQTLSPIWGRVRWIRYLRIITNFLGGFYWTTVFCITAFHLPFVPFMATTFVYSLASWWVFLRTSDCRPLPYREKNDGA